MSFVPSLPAVPNAWLHNSPLAPHLDAFAAHLADGGYSAQTTRWVGLQLFKLVSSQHGSFEIASVIDPEPSSRDTCPCHEGRQVYCIERKLESVQKVPF